MITDNLNIIVSILKKGGIIAYPTEGVFGLGCDPTNEKALQRLLHIKHRPQNKGLIIIGADWTQLFPYMAELSSNLLKILTQERAEPTTWLVPASTSISHFITGGSKKVAVRKTTHPIVQKLCLAFNAPLISTSANYSHQPPCLTSDAVAEQFKNQLDAIVGGETGILKGPTPIYDLISGEKVR